MVLFTKVRVGFFNDILIYSTYMHEHMTHLATILETLVNNPFVANIKKCQFGIPQIEYLGHIVFANGVAADLSKLDG